MIVDAPRIAFLRAQDRSWAEIKAEIVRMRGSEALTNSPTSIQGQIKLYLVCLRVWGISFRGSKFFSGWTYLWCGPISHH